MYCYYSYGFKNERNVIKIAIFWRKITKVIQQLGALPPNPSVIRLSCIGLFSTGPKLDNFCTKKSTLDSNPLSLNKILAALLVALWFQKRANYDRNDVKIAICCRKITKITQTLEALPPGPLCNKLELHQLV